MSRCRSSAPLPPIVGYIFGQPYSEPERPAPRGKPRKVSVIWNNAEDRAYVVGQTYGGGWLYECPTSDGGKVLVEAGRVVAAASPGCEVARTRRATFRPARITDWVREQVRWGSGNLGKHGLVEYLSDAEMRDLYLHDCIAFRAE